MTFQNQRFYENSKDTGRDYAKKLKDANIPTIHREMKGMMHCIPGPFNESDRVNLYKQIAEEAQKYLKK